MAKDIAWRALKKLVPKVWIKTKNETDLRIELINGSTLSLIHISEPTRPY